MALTKKRDEQNKALSKLITVNCVRNTIIENYHAEGKISDEEMKAFNKEVCNHIYTALTIYARANGEELNLLLGMWDSSGGVDAWDDPIYNPHMDAMMEKFKSLQKYFRESSTLQRFFNNLG